jgi:hypothetical protein
MLTNLFKEIAMKNWIIGFTLSAISSATFAMNSAPNFVLLPNVKTQHLMLTNAIRAVSIENQAIELVKETLKITDNSPYKTIRIRFVYDNHAQPQALIVALLSTQTKNVEFVRIDLNNQFIATSVLRHYKLTPADVAESPAYARKALPHCLDESVQFVIGNNFTGDNSVEKEVQKVYQLAKNKGYNPILMDTNNSAGPQPTVESYENWLSCPNVKGFYNESHGFNQGIVLSDDDFLYTVVDNDLVEKMKQDVVLFDSCDTFQDPLLSAMTKVNEGDSQDYIAGIIPLPFGSSERTAACIWENAFAHEPLTQKLIEVCANKFGLEPDAFRITGNGDTHLRPASA